MRSSFTARRSLALAACLGLAGCASAPQVRAMQEAVLEQPRTIDLAVEPGQTLPFGLAAGEVAHFAEQAGFAVATDEPARYRLTIAAAAGSRAAASYLPPAEAKGRPDWVARPRHGWRESVERGDVMRVTIVLIDNATNREVWRGVASAHGTDQSATARQLAAELLAKLPRT
jgi:hypothetical protein